MTRLAILTPKEKREFDQPPRFKKEDRARYFYLSPKIRQLAFNKLRSSVNQVGFILQLGYFRATGKFFVSGEFRKKDIYYVCQLLKMDKKAVTMDQYTETSRKNHREKLLSLSGWRLMNDGDDEQLIAKAKWYIEQQISPQKVFSGLVEHCADNKIVIPGYSKLSSYITDYYNYYEKQLIDILDKTLNSEQKSLLDALLKPESMEEASSRAPITQLKAINQSVKPGDIKKNVEVFEHIKGYYLKLNPLIEVLNLTDQAVEYFATWVKKAQTFQLNSFANPFKTYLYTMAYLKHQVYLRHDTLIDIFLSAVSSHQSKIVSELKKLDKAEQTQRNYAIKTITHSNKELTRFSESVVDIVSHDHLSNQAKLKALESIVEEHLKSFDEKVRERNLKMQEYLEMVQGTQRYFEIKESLSIALQRRVSDILKTLSLSGKSTDSSLVEAIEHFKLTDGNLGKQPSMTFMSEEERQAVNAKNGFKVSLYKAILFQHIAEAIKAGALIFQQTYKHKGIFDYLIDETIWKQNRDKLLETAGLKKFADVNAVLKELKQQLSQKYTEVNTRLVSDENPLLAVENGKLKVKTPKIDNDDFAFVGETLMQNGFVPIQTILSDVNAVCRFSDCFTHFSNKSFKMRPGQKLILAGIIGKGCNLGLNRMANISNKSITEDMLNNAVTWFFDLDNVNAASNKINDYIDRLALANAYKYNPDETHTSSDGQKYYVAVDSLNSTYSFKYFGKDKGSTIYTFMDEKQRLFYSTVISASEREAAYVIDGLVNNDVIKSDIHSTDTHGYTESIFGTTYFMGIAFAPRIKGVTNQKIYDFDTQKSHREKGHIILPKRAIKQKLIINHWEDILRFMVTIKLKKSSASQLFSKLNSYTRDIPLYNALKEFGALIKSNFILTYFDDVGLRQRVEKQLNRIELSNKLAKAIFFANNQELQEGEPGEQQMAAACKMLIQNAIVLWNYLYLSEYLANLTDEQEKEKASQSIINGSVLTWRHINLHGEYHFERESANDPTFDVDKILSLTI